MLRLLVLLALLACVTSVRAMPAARALGLKKGMRRERREVDVDVLAAGSMSKEVTLNPFDLCLCGSFATALGDFLMHPLDTIKIMQQSGKVKGGLFQVARQIFKDSGIAGFYPGVTAYVMGDGLSGAVKFASFEVSKKWLEERTDESQHGMVQFLCAAGAMIACSVVLVPGEVIKTRMQAGTIDNMFAGIASIVKTDGIAGLYQGYFSTLLRDVPYTMLELGLYENIKSSIQRYNQRQEQQQNGGKGGGKDVVLSRKDELIAAAITGGITGYLTTPLDVIKTKLMLASGGAAAPGFMAVLAETYKSGEVFLGVTARVSWILPFTAFYLPVYDGAKRRLLEYKKQQAANKK